MPDPSVPIECTIAAELGEQDVWIDGNSGDQEDTNWIRVLLPGCGPAWAESATISTISHEQARLKVPSPRLSIAFVTDQSLPAVLELLKLIGRTVKDLYIINFTTQDPLDDWLVNVARACPHLESFGIAGGGRISSMDVFATMCQHESSQLRSLFVRDTLISDTTSITRFMARLADARDKMSKQLQKIDFGARRLDSPLETMRPVLDSMLSTNTVLQELKMMVSFQSHLEFTGFDNVTALCERHQGKPVTVRQGPLRSRQKYAFCSVLESHDSHPATRIATSGWKARRVMRRLDHAVLTLIFEFAAECKSRNVSIFMYTERPANAEAEN